MNAVLPKTIQIIAWAPVPKIFNSRYDCSRRTYKYFFPVADFDLNVSLYFLSLYLIFKSILLEMERKIVGNEKSLYILDWRARFSKFLSNRSLAY